MINEQVIQEIVNLAVATEEDRKHFCERNKIAWKGSLSKSFIEHQRQIESKRVALNLVRRLDAAIRLGVDPRELIDQLRKIYDGSPDSEDAQSTGISHEEGAKST